MKDYVIEWHGTITRDIGWECVRANSVDEARQLFETQHGTNRKIKAISEAKIVRGI